MKGENVKSINEDIMDIIEECLEGLGPEEREQLLATVPSPCQLNRTMEEILARIEELSQRPPRTLLESGL